MHNAALNCGTQLAKTKAMQEMAWLVPLRRPRPGHGLEGTTPHWRRRRMRQHLGHREAGALPLRFGSSLKAPLSPIQFPSYLYHILSRKIPSGLLEQRIETTFQDRLNPNWLCLFIQMRKDHLFCKLNGTFYIVYVKFTPLSVSSLCPDMSGCSRALGFRL
jgi:hypothetical protein